MNPDFAGASARAGRPGFAHFRLTLHPPQAKARAGRFAVLQSLAHREVRLKSRQRSWRASALKQGCFYALQIPGALFPFFNF